MTESKTHCERCNCEILQATANRTNGLCMPCKQGRESKPQKPSINRSEIWKGSDISIIQHFGDEILNPLKAFVEQAWGDPTVGEIQKSENYDVVITQEEWRPTGELLRCPIWYATILKAIPLSGLCFLAPSPENSYPEEHEFLPLPGWAAVAEDYEFFIPEFMNRGDYPIALSGYGYLVIKAGGTHDDPIDRWDGSGMKPLQAFSNFSEFVRSMSPCSHPR